MHSTVSFMQGSPAPCVCCCRTLCVVQLRQWVGVLTCNLGGVHLPRHGVPELNACHMTPSICLQCFPQFICASPCCSSCQHTNNCGTNSSYHMITFTSRSSSRCRDTSTCSVLQQILPHGSTTPWHHMRTHITDWSRQSLRYHHHHFVLHHQPKDAHSS